MRVRSNYAGPEIRLARELRAEADVGAERSRALRRTRRGELADARCLPGTGGSNGNYERRRNQRKYKDEPSHLFLLS